MYLADCQYTNILSQIGRIFMSNCFLLPIFYENLNFGTLFADSFMRS